MVADSTKQPYIARESYPDMMKNVTAQDVWNYFYRQFGGLSEAKGIQSSLEFKKLPALVQEQISNYIKQSEKKKPYSPGDTDYLGMEYDTDPPEYPIVPDDPHDPWHIVFNTWVNGCYRKGKTMPIELYHSEPLISLEVLFGFPGTLTESSVTVKPTSDSLGSLPYVAWMQSSEGIVDWANDFVPECQHSCADINEINWDNSNPSTIAPDSNISIDVLDGQGPFDWTVHGVDVWFEEDVTVGRTNILRTGPKACGTFEIFVTDSCDGLAEGIVRCTVGAWHGIIEDCGDISMDWHSSICFQDGRRFEVNHYNCSYPQHQSGNICDDHPCCGCSSYYCQEGSVEFGWVCHD